MTATKIATCCYCGTRAALVLAGETRHELACSGCGAPLHNLKALPSEAVRPMPQGVRHPTPSGPGPGMQAPLSRKQLKKIRKKKRKSPSQRLLSKTFDLIEDIFD